MKQTRQLFLAVVLLLCTIATNVKAEIYEGSCGDHATYTFNTNTGSLFITGYGEMKKFEYSLYWPWYTYKDAIRKVTISSGITYIGDWAFSDCYNIASVSIPSTVTKIGIGAFRNCTSLSNINIPNSVTYLEEGAFYNCSGLKSINIPNSITKTDGYIFVGCTGLKTITIPYSITIIDRNSFDGCTGLTSVHIPNSVEKIAIGAFRECSGLTSITIPSSVTFIDAGVFSECTNLKKVINLSKTPQQIDKSTFSIYGTLHVPHGCGEAYRNSPYWNNFTILEDAVEPLLKYCAKPEITYSNNTITCTSETEGSICHFTYTLKNYEDGSVENSATIIPQIEVTAYATADGYEQSETVAKTFDLTAAPIGNCDVNGDGAVTMKDANIIVNTYLGK